MHSTLKHYIKLVLAVHSELAVARNRKTASAETWPCAHPHCTTFCATLLGVWPQGKLTLWSSEHACMTLPLDTVQRAKTGFPGTPSNILWRRA